MRSGLLLAAILSVFVAAGCSLQEVAKRTAPPEAVSLVEKTVDDFRAQKTSELDKDLAPGLVKLLADKALVEEMLAAFPKRPVTAIHVERWQTATYMGNIFGRDTEQERGSEVTTLVLRYEFEGGDAVRVTAALALHHGVLQLNQFYVLPMPHDLIAYNALSNHWDSFGGRQIFVLLTLAVVIFVGSAAVSCWLTPGLRFKWLWTAAILLLNVVQFTLVWSTEKVFMNPLVLKVPPVWIEQTSPYDPAAIWFLLPIGAIAFWSWRSMAHHAKATPPRSFTDDQR